MTHSAFNFKISGKVGLDETLLKVRMGVTEVIGLRLLPRIHACYFRESSLNPGLIESLNRRRFHYKALGCLTE